MRENIVVLLSGGLDSTVTLWAAAKRHDPRHVHLLSFAYGQRHQRELQAADAVIRLFKRDHPDVQVTHRVLALPPLFGENALTGSTPVPQDRDETNTPAALPATFVPGRNLVFLAMASAYGRGVGANILFAGFNAVDYSGYPDCRVDFVLSMEKTACLAFGLKPGSEGFRVYAPLINMTKRDIIALGVSLGAPMYATWSCYQGGDKPCGKCDSCIIRNKAAAELGVEL